METLLSLFLVARIWHWKSRRTLTLQASLNATASHTESRRGRGIDLTGDSRAVDYRRAGHTLTYYINAIDTSAFARATASACSPSR